MQSFRRRAPIQNQKKKKTSHCAINWVFILMHQVALALSSYSLCKHKRYKATVTVTDASWWRQHGIDRYSLSFAVLKYSTWCHASSLKEVVCRVCDPKKGNVVKMSPAPMPQDCNSVEFDVTPVCNSTRSHIGSQIRLVVQGFPGLDIVSPPVTLISRTSRKRQGLTKQLTVITKNECTNVPHGDFKLLIGVEDGQMFYECFSLLPQIAQTEAREHPQNILFSKSLSQMEITRPFIWVYLVRFKPEIIELYSVWLSCAGRFYTLIYELPLTYEGTSVVIMVFPSLVSAILAESAFLSRWAMLHSQNCLELFQPSNRWMDLIGWASNSVF
ncbi:hypothetical protein Pelo_1510 [Pelomyxa schiedti]|nr:hypothetical protein Pelo_1510 [Pelomyxa schiedti]